MESVRLRNQPVREQAQLLLDATLHLAAGRKTSPLPAAKHVLQIRIATGYTLSLERPPFSGHLLRLDNAVMPEPTASFRFKTILRAYSWWVIGLKRKAQRHLHLPRAADCFRYLSQPTGAVVEISGLARSVAAGSAR